MAYECHVGTKHDKNRLKAFYKHQHFSAGFKGLDTFYYIADKHQIIGSMIYSQIEQSATQLLLHAFVIDRQFRKKHLASKLHAFAYQHVSQLSHQPAKSLICFAETSLTGFYQKLGYNSINDNELCSALLPRYQAYVKQNPNLLIFQRPIKQQS